jgi:EAL domain-containing protein (putative c-di-GMP-specific phosphodiesterase class I)
VRRFPTPFELGPALKADRLLLYAQRITPLRNPSLPGGYELLLRLKTEDGSLVAPGPLIVTAQRYQLLPSVDRWVIQRALQMLAPYRGMLKSRGLSMSINVSGQSIGDETFVHHFREQLKAANLPRDCVTIEITEQAAVTNIARANGMIQQLTALGCRFALDDFGTGSNSRKGYRWTRLPSMSRQKLLQKRYVDSGSIMRRAMHSADLNRRAPYWRV